MNVYKKKTVTYWQSKQTPTTAASYLVTKINVKH